MTVSTFANQHRLAVHAHKQAVKNWLRSSDENEDSPFRTRCRKLAIKTAKELEKAHYKLQLALKLQCLIEKMKK